VTGSPEDVVGCSGRLLLPNTTQVPNVVLDRWMAPMTGAEIKVVLYMVRRTYGFRRTSDRISVAQMSMSHGSFSTTMKYYTGLAADLQ
jgi:integrase